MKFKIYIRQIRGNLYLGSCKDLPGCHIQASSEKSARDLLSKAIRAYLESYQQHYEKLPLEE